MTEEFLLMVFIGLVAVAFVVIATSIGLVAWHVIKLLTEVEKIVDELHVAGVRAIKEIRGVPSQILGAIMGLVTKQPRRSRQRKKTEDEE